MVSAILHTLPFLASHPSLCQPHSIRRACVYAPAVGEDFFHVPEAPWSSHGNCVHWKVLPDNSMNETPDPNMRGGGTKFQLISRCSECPMAT